MPTYLCHGFRWQRKSVRVYVILQNIDDASPEWIIPAKTSQSILQSFYEVFEFLPYCSPKASRYPAARDPDTDDDDRSQSRSQSRTRRRGRSESLGTAQSRSLSRARHQQPLPPLPPAAEDASSTADEDDFSAQSWSAVKLLEEYDPRDLTAVSRPYAYVADYAVRIDLSCSIVDEIARYEQLQLQSPHPAIAIPSRKEPQGSGSGWFEDLRDQLQAGEEIRWYVVVNDDEVRDCADDEAESATAPRRDPGYQQPQYPPYQYQPLSSRPTASIEQRQHHAQYMHQQRIFEVEGAAQKAEPEQEPQPKVERQQPQQQQQQQQILDWNSRETKREQERQREKEKDKERERQREQEKQKQREREKERQWQQEKERLREKDRQQHQRQRDQRDQNPPSYGADANGKPPTVPEKDLFHFPRPPTATANAGTNAAPPRPKMSLDIGAARPLRSKMSFDAGIGRPKTPGGKGGGLRRLFGRGKVDAGYPA